MNVRYAPLPSAISPSDTSIFGKRMKLHKIPHPPYSYHRPITLIRPEKLCDSAKDKHKEQKKDMYKRDVNQK